MIIGKNNNSNFNNPTNINKIKSNNMINNSFTRNENFKEKNFSMDNNMLTKNINDIEHANPTSVNEMGDKTLAMLHKRLQDGEITMEEFNRKCNALGNFRNKN